MAKSKSQSLRLQGPRRRPIRAKKRASFYTTWMRWPDACQQVRDHVKAWRLVLAELTPSLQAGETKALVRAVDLRTNKYFDHRVPKQFWTQVRIWEGDDRLEIEWSGWLHKLRRKNAIPNWWPSDGSPHFQ